MYLTPLLLLTTLALMIVILVKLNKKNSEAYVVSDPSPDVPNPCPVGDNIYCKLAKILNNYLFDGNTALDLMKYFNAHSSEIEGMVQSFASLPDKITIGTITLTKGQGNSLVFYGCGSYLMSQANSPDSISDCPF